MKIWVDDIREMPFGYDIWCRSTDDAIAIIDHCVNNNIIIELLDLDHDAGDYSQNGGDYIKILDYIEYKDITPEAVRIHSMNSVGIQNMRRIIHKNNWKEVR